MSQNPYPNNVPDATKGASDSVAAPGCVGVRGTTFKARLKEAWDWVPPDVRYALWQLLGLLVYSVVVSVSVAFCVCATLAIIFQAAKIFTGAL
ncbi:hypothetical protein [Comamonas sp. lk]|uniref:hypothetical protein n=1 Tax=Comamonas sp. lk TaxID=2201272 RepID=UPI0013CEF94A|nr:hypothetical protein [Comamonas sp. lk]